MDKLAKSRGCSVVKTYCGHGIGELFHTAPNVPHYAKNKAVGVMEPGHIFTIEPMINVGGWRDKTWPDDWTAVVSRAGSLPWRGMVAAPPLVPRGYSAEARVAAPPRAPRGSSVDASRSVRAPTSPNLSAGCSRGNRPVGPGAERRRNVQDTQSRRNFDSMFATRPLHRCAQTYMVPAQVTADGSRSAQFEHTFLVTADGYEILTMRENEPRMVWDLAKQQR